MEKIAIVGNNDAPLRLFNSLNTLRHNVCLVGVQNPLSPVLGKKYLDIGNRTKFIHSFDDNKLKYELDKVSPSFVINIFCNFKFKKVLDFYDVYNIHLSYLPKYRGRHPLHWALVNGEEEHGITMHLMNDIFDGGKIIWQKKEKIILGDSVKSLRERLLELIFEDFEAILLDLYKGKLLGKQNNNNESTPAPMRQPSDSEICDFSSSLKVYRLVKALSSEEQFMAFIKLNGERKILISDAVLLTSSSNISKDSFVNFQKNHIDIKCDDDKVIRLIKHNVK